MWRMRWLGHILCEGPSRLIFHAVEVQYRAGSLGNLFMDVSEHLSFYHLVLMVMDKKFWRARVEGIPDEPIVKPVASAGLQGRRTRSSASAAAATTHGTAQQC